MKKIALLFCLLLMTIASNAQIANNGEPFDYQSLPGYSRQKAIRTASMVSTAVFSTAWLAGNVLCVVEENKYINSKGATTAQEILDYKAESHSLPAYKTGEVMEFAGFFGTAASLAVLYFSSKKMAKIRDAHRGTVAFLTIDQTPSGVGLVMRF